jgi:hypothetical protein
MRDPILWAVLLVLVALIFLTVAGVIEWTW